MTDDRERQALLSLSLAALPDGAAILERLQSAFEFQWLPVDESLRVLASRRSEPQPTLRPMVFRRIINLATHDGGQKLFDARDTLQTLYEALAVECGGGGAAADPAPIARRLEAATVRLAETHPDFDYPEPLAWDRLELPPHKPPPGSTEPRLATTGERTPPPPPDPPENKPTPEEEFVATAAVVLDVAEETIGSPLCADEDTIEGTKNGYTVKTRWWSPKSIFQLRPWTDPRNWPGCEHKVFFKDMAVEKIDTIPGHTKWWSADMAETVELVKGYPITTRLHFDHCEVGAWDDTNDSPITCIYTDYDFAHPIDHKGELMIDHGTIQLRKLQNPTTTKKTEVILTKNFEFRTSAYWEWPTLACDTFFAEIAIMMATNCTKSYNPNI